MKTIWVIGGAGYLGQAIIRNLIEKGYRVLCADIGEKAHQFAGESERNPLLIPISLDASGEDLIHQFVHQNVEKYGIPDGLVILTYGAAGQNFNDITADDFNRASHLGVTSTFIMARAVGQEMKKLHKGSIVLFSSMYGMVSPDPAIYELPMEANPIEYGVGKAGIIQMTKYLAVHWARSGIRCNCISPGPFPNQIIQNSHPEFIQRLSQKVPMGRVGQAQEIAGPVHFLLSEESSYMTGQNMVVDGGWTIW